eukprot:1349009-Amorphochlora_amoeboformis.AAC.2
MIRTHRIFRNLQICPRGRYFSTHWGGGERKIATPTEILDYWYGGSKEAWDRERAPSDELEE